MLELSLTLQNQLVSVSVNGKESHQFPRIDLEQSKEEWENFLDNPRPFGEKLFNALFKDIAQTEFNALSKQTEQAIVLVLESPELDSVAWEYAYNKAKEEYVVEGCTFVRALPESERPANGRLKSSYERVPLLFIPANPLVDLGGKPMRSLDVDGEWEVITRHIMTSNAPLDLWQLRPATPQTLQTMMANFPEGLIVHFSGHGATGKDGAILLFEERNGAAKEYTAREFVREVKDKAIITFLSACQSAVAGKTEFSNLARELVKAGVSFALGMQFNLPDNYDDIISEQFYNYLSRGYTIPEATLQARRALKREAKKTEEEFFVGMIALYAAHPDEAGLLSWKGAGALLVQNFGKANVDELPIPASGLIGRQRELMRIGTRLLEGTKPLTVTLHGAGGIGKTALLWQALLRFAPSFDLTLAIGLDTLPTFSLESVLVKIESFLKLNSSYENETKKREAIVRNALKSKHTLLGLDNFETLNYALNDEGSEIQNTAKSLHEFFSSLCSEGVTLCVTSRQATDLPNEELFEIYGLEEKLGAKLFREFSGDRRDTLTEFQTYKISEAVDGHPLALQLLGSIYKRRADLSLDEFLKKIQDLLSETQNQWTKNKRHISLEECFSFSMDNLPKTEEGRDLQVAISRLSVFTTFFVYTTAAPVLENRFPEAVEELQQMFPKTIKVLNNLWECSLLERAIIPLEEENFPLYRLHPALRFFASKRLVDVESVKENYWKSMSNFTGLALVERSKNPLVARIAFSSVPDLLLAAEFKNDGEDAALMQFGVSKLLKQFGLYDDSLHLLEKSRNISQSIKDLKGESAAIYEMAQIYKIRGELSMAMKLCQQSLDIDPNEKSSIFTVMASIHVAQGDLNRALKLYQDALIHIEEIGDQRDKSVILHEMAGIYITQGDLDKAMSMYQQSLSTSRELNELRDISSTLNNMARIYVIHGDFDGAMNLYQQSLELKNKLSDLEGTPETLGNMAHILLIHNDLDGAQQLLLQSLDIHEKIGNLHGKATALGNLSEIYFLQGNTDYALETLRQALEIDVQINDLSGKSVHLANVARILQEKNQNEDALLVFSQSLAIARDLHEPFAIANILMMMGVCFVQLSQDERGMECLIEAFILFMQLESKEKSKKVIDYLQYIQESLGEKKFGTLWKKITNSDVPDFLSPSSPTSASI